MTRPSAREIARRYVHEPEFRRGFNRGLGQGVRSPKGRAGFERNFRSAGLAGALGSTGGMRYVQYLRSHSHQSIGTLGELRFALIGALAAVTAWCAVEFVYRRARRAHAG